MLHLEELARDRVADRLRQADHDALVADARRHLASRVDAARVVQPARVRQLAATGLRMLAARLDACAIVTSTRAESVPIQPYLLKRMR